MNINQLNINHLGQLIQVMPGTVYVGGGQDMRYCYEHGEVWIYADGTVRIYEG